MDSGKQHDQMQAWITSMLEDAQRQLGIDDATLGYTLLHRGIRYLRTGYKLQLNEDFLCWLEETIRAGRKQLGFTDKELANLLLAAGTQHYLKAAARAMLEDIP